MTNHATQLQQQPPRRQLLQKQRNDHMFIRSISHSKLTHKAIAAGTAFGRTQHKYLDTLTMIVNLVHVAKDSPEAVKELALVLYFVDFFVQQK